MKQMLNQLNYDFKDGYYYNERFYIESYGSARDLEYDTNKSLQDEEAFATLFLQNIEYCPHKEDVYEIAYEEVIFDVSAIEYDFENHNNTISFVVDKYEYYRNRKQIDDFINAYSVKKFTPTVTLLMDYYSFKRRKVVALASSLSITETDDKFRLSFTVFDIKIEN